MEKNLKYKFQKLALDQFAIIDTSIDEKNPVAGFQTAINFGFDVVNHVLNSQVSVVMNQGNKPLVKAVLRCYFGIAPESVVALTTENKIMFEPPILIQFASFCYGALRGVLFVKTEGTGLERFVLPPIYFQDLIKEPFIIQQ